MTRDAAAEVARLHAELERERQAHEVALREHDEHRRALLALLEDMEAGRQKLEQAQHEWNAAFDAVADPIFLHDKDFRIARANRAYANRAGLPFRELLGRLYWEAFPKGAGPLAACRRAMESAAEEEAGEEELRLETGEVFQSRSFPVRGTGGAWLFGVHILQDVTEKRRAEKTLRESEEKFHRITAAAQDAILMMDNDGRVVFWNAAAERIFGYTAREILGQALHPLLAPERYHADHRKGFARFRDTGEGPVIGKTLELVARHKDGAEFPIELSVSALKLGDRWHAVGVLRDITERRRAEQALRESETHHRTLAENLPGIVYRVYVRENNRMEFFNNVAAEMTGYAADELVAGVVCSLDPLIVAEDRTRVIATVERAVAENHSFTVEYRLRHKTGDIRHLLEKGTPVPGPDGKPLYIDGVIFDVTERSRAAQELARAKELLERMFESIHVLVAYMDRDFNFIRVNRAYAEADARVPEFFLGKNHFALYPDKEVEAIFRQVVETGEPYVAVERPFRYVEHPERGVSYWDWRVEPVKGIGGVRVEGVVFSLFNVTERKRAAEEIRVSRDLLRSVVENAPIRVFWKDAESRYLGCNSAFARDAGLSYPEELLGKDDFQMGWREQAELYRADDKRVMEADTPKIGFEEPQTTPDGRTIWLRTSKVPLHDADGKVFGVLGIYEDITERKRAEDELRRSEAGLAEAQRIARLGSWEFDLVANKLTWSDEIYRIFELDPKQFGASYEAFLDAIHPDDREAVDRAYTEHVKKRVPYDIVHRLIFKDGRIKYVHERCETAYGAGRALRSLGTVQDITERKLAEIALSKINRALKTLSAGNEALVRATDEAALLRDMCRVIVEVGGYRMAWVGFDGSGTPEKLRPVGKAGHDDGFLDVLQLVWTGPEREQIPTTRALRSGEPQVTPRIETASIPPALAPWREEALKRGYRACLALPLSFEGQPFGVLDIFAAEPNAFDDEEVRLLTELADDMSYGIVNLRSRKEVVEGAQRLRRSLETTVGAIAATVEMRDPYTAGHERRVLELAVAIAREMGLTEEKVEGLHFAALIHDIGKIHIPAEILSKPAKLSPIEFELIKTHCQVGYDILKGIEFPWPVARMVLEHHEHLDGSGYPKGLKDEQILPESRILTVADVVEAMSSHRPYRPALGIEAALADITTHRGSWYDADAVDACVRLFREKGFRFS